MMKSGLFMLALVLAASTQFAHATMTGNSVSGKHDIGNKISGAKDHIHGAVGSAVDALGNAVGAVGNAAGAAVDGAKDHIASGISAKREMVAGAANGVKEVVQATVSGKRDVVEGTMGLIESVGDLKTEIKEEVHTALLKAVSPKPRAAISAAPVSGKHDISGKKHFKFGFGN